jgi:hypothetical protein
MLASMTMTAELTMIYHLRKAICYISSVLMKVIGGSHGVNQPVKRAISPAIMWLNGRVWMLKNGILVK